ncbi:MAG TPA: ATP-binding protein [Clostridiales bacterium]|nr:ATP-binding protein [Clostridiales bacterium]
MNDNKTNDKRNYVFRIITFPIYMISYLIKKAAEKRRFSIRLSLSLVYLKIVIRTLVLTGILIFLAYGGIRIYYIYQNYKLIVEKVITSQKIESGTLKDVLDEKRHIAVYDKDENYLFDTAGSDLEIYKHKHIAYFTVIDNSYFLILDKKVLLSGEIFFLNIYTNVTTEAKDIYNLLKIILLANIIGTIFAGIWSIFAGRNVFLPIREMTETARSISEKNMNVRLNISGSKNELKDLARTFNEMMDRIEDGYNRQKQFVSDASHELRTPIAVLQGYIDMLNRWGKNDREILQESIDAIKNETENMKDLVENLLFLARNDRGTLILQKEEFSLTNLLEETIKETVLIDKRHKLSCNIKNGVNIYADRNRIKQAMRIFLDNAIKYTPEAGEITVNLYADKNYAAIEIIDTGIGMSEDEMKHIFDRFYRSDKSRKRERGGHGLGLSIAKIIILSHDGKINVKSKPVEGTRIKVFFPYK